MKKLFFIAVLLLTHSVYAQPSFKDCQSDIKNLCPDKKSNLENLSCLIENKPKLSSDCVQELDRTSGMLKSTGTRGSGGLGSFSGIMGGMGLMAPQKRVVTYTGNVAPEKDPSSIQQQRLTLATPVWAHGKESFAMSLNTARIEWGEPINWKSETFKTPRRLDRVELGGQYSKQLGGSKILGLRASLGSASDKAFYGMDEMTFSFNGTYTKPASERNYWIYTVFISNNNPIANYVPIPGFIYLKKTEKFTGMFGLPFLSLQWTPTKPLIFSTSFFITNFNAEVAYVLTDRLHTFTGFSTGQQTFLRKDRTEMRDRLFFKEKKIYLGLKVPFGSSLSGDFQLGQSFDRKVSEGRRFSDRDLYADFGRSWYSSLNVSLMY